MMSMANTSIVYARIGTGLKENAEEILSQLGLSPSSAIQMFYAQIILKRGCPLNFGSPPKSQLLWPHDPWTIRRIADERHRVHEIQENLYSRRSRCQAETRVWHMSDAYSTYCKKKLTCKWSALTCLRSRALDPVIRIQEEMRPLDFMPARYTIMIGAVEKHKLYWWRQSHNNYPDLLWWKRCRGHR